MHVVCRPVKSLTHDYHLGLAARVRVRLRNLTPTLTLTLTPSLNMSSHDLGLSGYTVETTPNMPGTRNNAALTQGSPPRSQGAHATIQDCSLVRRTLARAQAVSTRAWLTAAHRAVPGDAPTPTPRLVLTATRHFALRRGLARRGRARPKGPFGAVRGLPTPVAVSSAARHALPNPSYYPVRAADSQHTPECMARAAEQPSPPPCVPRRGADT